MGRALAPQAQGSAKSRRNVHTDPGRDKVNARCSLDFVQHQFAQGDASAFSTSWMTVMRERLAAIPDISISGKRVAREASDDRFGQRHRVQLERHPRLGKMKVQWQVRRPEGKLILLYGSFLRPSCWLFDKKIFCFFSTLYCGLQPSWCCTTTSPCFSLRTTILRRNLPPPQPAPTPAPHTPTE